MTQTPALPPPLAVLQLATGRWVSHIVGVAAELGLADQVQSGPKTAEELARASGLNAGALLRLLRTLANLGIFAEQNDGRFAQTPMSDALRSDVPYSMRGMARMVNRPWSIKSWTELEHAVRTGESAFEKVHGKQAFEYMVEEPKEMEIFANAMSSFTAQVGAAVADAYDFSQLGSLADVGGSHGMVLTILLNKFPQLRGVLFDLPQVVPGARPLLEARGVAQRVEVVGGSFFESAPGGVDAYLLKNILHDWSDADSVRILKSIHAAAKPQAKLLLVEAVLEEGNAPQFAKVLDIEMLVITHGGRERNLREWKQLIEQSGFRFSRVVPTASPASVIEAIKA
jgi:O-methyltransferase domain/Dimerisation domain